MASMRGSAEPVSSSAASLPSSMPAAQGLADDRLRKLIDRVLAFVGVLSLDGTLLEANEPAVTAAGVGRDELIGRPFWDCHWWSYDTGVQERLREAVAEAAGGSAVRYDAQVRVAGDQRIWIDFQIVPIVSEDGVVTELVPSGVDITERKLAEGHRELLLKELSHRVKNTLATIQSMAGQTLRGASSPEEFRSAFGARLQAIAASHDLLVAANHASVSLPDLVRGQVLPYAPSKDQLVLTGEDMQLAGESAHALGLVLHELATNAAKYGALSVPGGTVRIAWSCRSDGGLNIEWREREGPAVREPERRGFGTKLIERTAAPADGADAVIDYAPEGVTARLVLGER